MSPDAALRLQVYQEGQRAYRTGATCPYADWRSGTWYKGWTAAEVYATSPLPESTDGESPADPTESNLMSELKTRIQDLEAVARFVIYHHKGNHSPLGGAARKVLGMRPGAPLSSESIAAMHRTVDKLRYRD